MKREYSGCVMTRTVKREAGKERRGCSVGRIDSGRGGEPKRGVLVAVMPGALSTHVQV